MDTHKHLFKEWLNRDSPEPLNPAELEATAQDLADLWEEGRYSQFIFLEDYYREWLRRLGGAKNIPSYAAVMAAQAAREEQKGL